MIRYIRELIPNWLVNYGKHLPEAIIANVKFGFSGRNLRVIGVTGTDGKTTTTSMIDKILKDAGKSVSMISTINAEIAGKSYDTGFHVTNPDPWDLQKFLKAATLAKDEFMVLEVTSHGLSQFRTWGIDFEIGVITNVTHEHLDYHQTFKGYLLAKAKLIKNTKYAVLNRDDPSFAELAKNTLGKVVSFGLQSNADFSPGNFPLSLKIPGDYNLVNALAAAAATVNLGINKKAIKKSLENFRGLTGRMEEIQNRYGINIFVDFAHTPNALEQALKTLRPLTKGRLIAVFGCAGARDVAKRPLMGEISAKLADITVLTDEDPRFEDRNKIIEEIAQGALGGGAREGKTLFRQPDRLKAIRMAIVTAKKGDMVGIFGKGHERSINYKGVEKSWSDQEAVNKALKDGRKN